MRDFNTKRIQSLGLLFSYKGSQKDDNIEDRLFDGEYTRGMPQFVGDADICEIKLHPEETATKTSHPISLRMKFMRCNDAENVYLLVKPNESEKSRLPVLRSLKSNAIPVSLTKADSILEAFHCQEESRFNCHMRAKYLPQQRISNVVQILDNLFEASSKVATMVLAKGKDWIWENMSRTAPIFAEAWREGEYSSTECRALVARIRESANLSGCQDGEGTNGIEAGPHAYAHIFSAYREPDRCHPRQYRCNGNILRIFVGDG